MRDKLKHYISNFYFKNLKTRTKLTYVHEIVNIYSFEYNNKKFKHFIIIVEVPKTHYIKWKTYNLCFYTLNVSSLIAQLRVRSFTVLYLVQLTEAVQSGGKSIVCSFNGLKFSL